MLEATTRKAHSDRGVVITAEPGAKYFNERHKALAGDITDAPVALHLQCGGFRAVLDELFS